MKYIEIDSITHEIDYANLDQTWCLEVRECERPNFETLKRGPVEKVRITRLACGFKVPLLSELIALIENCETLDEVRALHRR